MNEIEGLLKRHGPMRGSVVAERLRERVNISSEAARKRISRIKPPVRRFPVQLFPKGESFLYLEEQRSSERFWTLLHAALRDANSIYGYAIDGLLARGGVVPATEFAVISGAPGAMKKQVSHERVLETLCAAGAVERGNLEDGNEYVSVARYELGNADFKHARSSRLAEGVLLDGVREWVRKLGVGSYNAVRIRGDSSERGVGPFKWDLTAPSYLAPMKRGEGKPGFVVADVFVDRILDEFEIRYFKRKSQLVNASIRTRVLPILVADGFTRKALQDGKSAGVMMATTGNLFGERVAEGLRELVRTLNNAAAVAATDPARLARLVKDLSGIEGAALNLRGILFELIVAYLARQEATSVDVGVRARDAKTGKRAEIDVFSVKSKAACVCIECKGKGPGGEVTVEEVEGWLRRIPIFRAHLVQQERFSEARQSFEMWTTGKFSTEALSKLEEEKARRTKWPIDWKDGRAVLEVARGAKEKAIGLALENHFLKHPLSGV